MPNKYHRLLSEDVQTGDVILLSKRDLRSKIISFIQKNKFNHSGNIIKINDVFFICEIEDNLMTLNPLSYYLENDKFDQILIARYKYNIKEKSKQDILNFQLYRCGKRVSDTSLIQYLLRKIFIKQACDREFEYGNWSMFLHNRFFKTFEYWCIGLPIDIYNSELYNKFIIKG